MEPRPPFEAAIADIGYFWRKVDMRRSGEA
jgi:hypothetical protein